MFNKEIFALALTCLLVACGGSSGSSSAPTAPGGFNDGSAPQATGGNDAGNTVTTAGDPRGCTYSLSSDITSPTRLVNTPNDCDYLLTNWIDVRSLLEIEPGTVIRSNPDERIFVEGGEIRAIGTPSQRIVFEGLASVQGYWRGIDVDFARGITMDYVDIKDAGQVCTILFCPDVGFQIDDSPLSFTNSSVSNSFVHGMSINEDVRIDAFSGNRFYGNGLNGLTISIERVPSLDAGTDYYGLERANGNPSVGVHSGEQFSGAVFQWKALNAPYFIRGFLNVEGGILQLDPGVEIVFDAEAWMTVRGNGVLQALGTETDPVIFRGAIATPGYWDGIRMSDTNFDTHILQHTILSH